MYSIYECMNSVIKELKTDGIPPEKLEFLSEDFSTIYSSENSLKEKAMKELVDDLVNEKIKLFIKKVMKRQFDKFIDTTMDIWDNMATGEILKLDKTIIHGTAAGMFGYPFNITYFFKQEGPEGPQYTFLDDDANKIYSDYRPV